VNIAPNGIAVSGGIVNNPTVNNYGPPPPPIPSITICISDLPRSPDGVYTKQFLLNTSSPVMEAWIALFFDGAVLDGSATSDPGSFGYSHGRADKLPDPENSFWLKVTSVDFGLPRWLPGRTIKVLIPSKEPVNMRKILTGSGNDGFDAPLLFPCGGEPPPK
jgi:hypothetical protein